MSITIPPVLKSQLVHGQDLSNVKSKTKLMWECDKSHQWEARVGNRINGSRCAYCINRKLLVGFNDLESRHPVLAKEWHSIKNGELQPTEIIAGSDIRAWWQCKEDHEWEASLASRIKGTGCPYCANQKVLAGFNDLATLYPILAKEWHSIKNGELQPTEITGSGRKKVWWQCKEGHEWEASSNTRTNMKSGCPYCANQKVLAGYNDLITTNPILAKQWHSVKNVNIQPTEVTAGSDIKVWWLGECGHEWKATVSGRSGTRNAGCPRCPTTSSKGEKELGEMILMANPDLELEYCLRTVIKGYELDIYLPEKNIAIEYNGLYWHSDRIRQDTNFHYKKWQACQDKGILLIQIWEDDWQNRKDLVTKLLKHKLEIYSEEKVYDSNTYVDKIEIEEANDFLNSNHIQGSVSGSLRYGLRRKTNNELVALMVLNAENSRLTLIRFAESTSVIGGFTKLLSHVKESHESYKAITAVSDNLISDDSLYANNGFLRTAYLRPDYMYVYKNARHHKAAFNRKRFKKDPSLQFEEGLTENQLAVLNKIPRIWDAGKTKWVLAT